MSLIIHRDEVPWTEAPLPPRIHKCFAQTVGALDNGNVINRCACGAFRYYPGPWDDVNSRRGKPAPAPKKVSLWQRFSDWRERRAKRCRVDEEWGGIFIGRRYCSTHREYWDGGGPCPKEEV